MPITLKCPACGSTLRVKDEMAGRRGPCPKCQAVVTVPEPAQSSSPASRPAITARVTPPAGGSQPAPVRSTSVSQAPAASAPQLAICPHCQSKFKVPATAIGKQSKCPRCAQTFVIRAAATPAPAPPPPPPPPPLPSSSLPSFGDDEYGLGAVAAPSNGSAIQLKKAAHEAAPAKPKKKRRSSEGWSIPRISIGALPGGGFLLFVLFMARLGLRLQRVGEAYEKGHREAFAESPDEVAALIESGEGFPAAHPPSLPSHAIWRPEFDTTQGPLAAGTAFLVRWPGVDRSLILTAHHLFGPSGGLNTLVRSAELPSFVNRVKLRDPSAPGFEIDAGPMLAIAGAEPMPLSSPAGDVAACLGPEDDASLTPWPVSQNRPDVGDAIWLVAEFGDMPGIIRYELARVAEYDPETGFIAYLFTGRLDLQATSGAPLVNSAGEVVGINLGGGFDDAQMIGIGVPVAKFAAALTTAAAGH